MGAVLRQLFVGMLPGLVDARLAIDEPGRFVAVYAVAARVRLNISVPATRSNLLRRSQILLPSDQHSTGDEQNQRCGLGD